MLVVVAGLYVIEGYPMGVFRDLWPVYLREAGASLATIGALSGLYVAWSLKVFWSPLVDRFGEFRTWIAGALVAMGLASLALPRFDLESVSIGLWTVWIAFCVGSATQDIAIDAYTIGVVPRGREGWANSVRITAYRVGLILGGGVLLFLPDLVGWPVTFQVSGALAFAMAIGVRLAPRVAVANAARRAPIRATWRWLSRPGGLSVLGFVLLYRLGDLGLAPMLKPFWVDRGFSNAEIATVSTAFGAGATVLGAIAGGAIVSSLGIGRALWVVGIAALGSNLGYAAAALASAQTPYPVYAASLVESFCSGLAAAGFLAYLMRICQREHAAVQYATLTALYALPGTFAGAISGVVTEEIGYGRYFAASALLALPAFLFLPRAQRWVDAVPEKREG